MNSEHEQLQQLCEAYALGALAGDELRQMENHLKSGCEECEAKLAEMSRVTSAIMSAVEPVEPRPALKAKILEGLHDHAASAPSDESSFFFLRALEGQWQTIAPGITAKILFSDPRLNRTTMLMRMAAGSQLVSHRHGSAEEIFVLEGDCLSQGQSLHAGDYHRAEGGSTHGVTSTENGCMMLVIAPKIEVV